MIRMFIGFVILSLSICDNPKPIQFSKEPSGWEILETPVDASLRGLSPISSDIAWFSGSKGTWLRTLDGGRTWQHGVIDGLVEVDFRSIHGVDADQAIAVSAGQPAVIYRTIDGGKTWKLIHQENQLAFLDGVAFSDQKVGFVFGDPIDQKWMMLKTINQGETWVPITSLPEAAVGEAGFAASSSAMMAERDLVVLGSGGRESNLYLSKDGGDSWEKIKSPMIQGEASQGIFAISGTDSGGLIALGGDYLQEDLNKGNVGVYNMATQQWSKIENPPAGYRSGVTFFSQSEWVITVGPSGTDFSKDGGINWKKFSDEGFHAVKTDAAKRSVWASGAKGKVAKLKF